jgi:general stress protein 26
MSEITSASYDDVTVYELTPEREQELLEKQVECVFMWGTKDGSPMGVIMNFLPKNDRIWLTATSQRARIKALRRDPRAAITVTSQGTDMGPGKTVTYKGKVIIHDDQATKDWFYPAMAKLLNGYPAPSEEAAMLMLDTPLRVVLEFVPEKAIKFDGDRIAQFSQQVADAQ